MSKQDEKIIRAIRKGITLFGDVDFCDGSPPAVRAVKGVFPNWKHHEIYPYLFPRWEFQLYHVDEGEFGTLYSVGESMYNVCEPENFRLVEAGLLIIGGDNCGGRLCLDTASESGLDMVITVGGAGSGTGSIEKVIKRFRRTLQDFFPWLHEHPDQLSY